MKTIKYSVKIEFCDKDQKHVQVETHASSEKELISNVTSLMKKEKKSFLGLFNL